MRITRLIGTCLAGLWLAATAGAQPLVVVEPMSVVSVSNAPTATATVVRMVAPRGGFASGQVVALVPPAGATLSELHGPGGVLRGRLRYPLAAGNRFDGLADSLATLPSVQPLWISVEVPATALPGRYLGELTAAGQRVPVELTVSGFRLPGAAGRQLLVSTLESADTVAAHYGVAPYSAAHFKLLEPSLELQGRLGNNVLSVPVIGRTYLGNQHGLIQFQGNTPDFRAFEQYLALYQKHCGPPKLVVVYLWDMYLADKEGRRGDPTTLAVSAIDAAGRLSPTTLPAYPANPALWQAVIEGVRKRIGGATLLLGQSSDVKVPAETVAMFKRIAPETKWLAWTHGYGYAGWNSETGQEIGVYESPDFTPSNEPVRSGWDESRVRLNTLRSWVVERSEPLRWRVSADLSCGRHKQGACRGFGKIGLDYWPLPAKPGERGSRSLWGGPYPGLNYCRLDRDQPSSITVPGPKGALSTIRLEMLAEGAQEAEARILIEQAIKAKKLEPAKAGSVLQARYNQILGMGKTQPIVLDPAWHEELLALYECAGQAQQLMETR